MHEGHASLPLSLLRTLSRVELVKIVFYVVLSLGAALAGSLAAILFVPLVQPGATLPFLGTWFDYRGDVDTQAVAFAAATMAFALMRWQAARLGARLVAAYGMGLRRRVHARLVDAALASLSDATSAEIANVLTYNVEIVVQGFSALQQLLVAAVTATVSLGFAFLVSPPLMLATPLFVAFAWLASRLFGREQAEVGRRYVADMTRLFWHSEDFPRRLRHVRSFGREEAEKTSYGDISGRLRDGYARQLELVASGRLFLEAIAAVAIAAVFMLARRWPGVDRASLVAVCLLLGRLLPYLVSTRQSFQQWRSAAPAFELWQRYMRMPTEVPLSSPPAETTLGGVLHIGFLRWSPPVPGLEVRHLRLVPGELTLVAGDSGIGKSSLADVLAGMVRPEVFNATLGGQAIDFDDYRARIRRGAYVSQSVRPWQRSVRDCLRWADPTADDDRLREAVRDVGLDDRLMRGGHDLDASLHDAANRLSGGELQRLMLAQVILRRPLLALLDEATSALDAGSEMNVLAALKRRLPGTILIVVSHRPAVAALSDQRLTIADGRVAIVRAGMECVETTAPSSRAI